MRKWIFSFVLSGLRLLWRSRERLADDHVPATERCETPPDSSPDTNLEDAGTQGPTRPGDLTALQLVDAFHAAEYRLFEGHLNLNLFGIRTGLDAGKWDDWIGALYQNAESEWILEMYQATTDPSDEWLKKGNEAKGGTAILKAGQWKGCWIVGLHRGKYPALVQHGAKMTVLRDGNLDDTLDIDDPSLVEDHGFHGINLHRGSAHKALIDEGIGPYSAGCQVICDPSDYAKLWDLILASSEKYGDRFSYTLFRWPLPVKDLPPLS